MIVLAEKEIGDESIGSVTLDPDGVVLWNTRDELDKRFPVNCVLTV